MKTTIEYLDMIKDRLKLPSDYALANALGITRESVSQLRNGKTSMGIETAMKAGEFLHIDGHAIYADSQIERAKKPEIREFWISISEKFSSSFKSLRSSWDGRERRAVPRTQPGFFVQ
jgi:DNA-binding XRE family transcriptional regulator